MDKNSIIEFLKKNQIKDIEEIKYKEDVLVVRYFYDFDDDEIEAATSYANDESGDSKDEDSFMSEYFLPYLSDIAVDNVGEILENLIDEMNVSGQFISYDIDEENYDYTEFVAVFTDKENDINIEDVMEDLKL